MLAIIAMELVGCISFISPSIPGTKAPARPMKMAAPYRIMGLSSPFAVVGSFSRCDALLFCPVMRETVRLV